MSYSEWAKKHDPVTRRKRMEGFARAKATIKEDQSLYTYNGVSMLGKFIWWVRQLAPRRNIRWVVTSKKVNGGLITNITEVVFWQWLSIPFSISTKELETNVKQKIS